MKCGQGTCFGKVFAWLAQRSAEYISLGQIEGVMGIGGLWPPHHKLLLELPLLL